MLAIIDVLATTARVLLSFLSNRTKPVRRSWRSEFVSRLARDFLERAIGHDFAWLRTRQACLTLYSPDLFKVQIEKQSFAGVPCLIIRPKGSFNSSNTIVYFHGGGYGVGSAKGYQLTAAKLALKTKSKVVLVDYRRVPEVALPGAQEDCFAVVETLLQDQSNSLVLMGDSAGGALCLATLKRLNQKHLELNPTEHILSRITACVMISPWVAPLSPETLSIENESCDILNRRITQHWVNHFFLKESQREWVDFSQIASLEIAPGSWPKVYLQVAGAEVFYRQVKALSAQLNALGITHEMDVFPDQFHVFQTFSPLVPEAEDALRAIAQFLRS